MNVFQKYPKTTLFILNLSLLLIIVIIAETIFGTWFREDKIQRLLIPRDVQIKYDISNLYSADYDSTNYTRDKFGLRGNFPKYNQIDILTIGGSTTDQRYIDDSRTWQTILQEKFNLEGNKIFIANAGIDGQSTFGHLKNFEWWFPSIPHLKPTYIFFYVGINDIFLSEETEFDYLISYKSDKDLLYVIRNNSFFYSAFRQLKNFIFPSRTVQDVLQKHVAFSKQMWSDEPLKTISSELMNVYLKNYGDRVNKLIDRTLDIGAIPVLITQPARVYKEQNNEIVGISDTIYVKSFAINGVDYYNILSKYNNKLEEIAKRRNVILVDVFTENSWEDDDFYDYFHMTPKGSKKLAEIIFRNVKHFIN